MLKQVEPTVDSPDQLLRMLDLELAARKAKRTATAGQRAAILAGGLLFLMTGTTAALFYLFTMLADLPHREGGGVPSGHTASSSTHR